MKKILNLLQAPVIIYGMVFEAGVSTFVFEDSPLSINELRQIKQSGFDVIEVWGKKTHFDFTAPPAIKELKAALTSSGIKVSSFHSPFGEQYDIGSRDEPVRRAAVKGIVSALQAMEELGGEKLVVHPGVQIKQGEDRALFISQVHRSLEEILKVCEKKKKVLAVENMLSGRLADSSEELWGMVNSFSSIYIGICLDTGHINTMGESLVHATKKLQSRLTTVHISDNNGEEDEHVLPGEGDIDWAKFIAALARCSYDGPFMYELKKGEDNSAILKKAKSIYENFKLIFKKNLV